MAENLDKLAREVDLPPLDLEGREVHQGGLIADLIARAQDDRVVVIENQLYRADFDHLGRTLAYASVFNANIVVWVAGSFGQEHIAAFRWLNEHSTDGVDFFAVQVRVFRIGQLLMAPQFEVLERPNEWARQVRVLQESGTELTGLSKLRHDFWAAYTKLYPEDGRIRSNYRAANIYRRVEGLVVSLYLAQGGVGIYIRETDIRYTEDDQRLARRCLEALKGAGIERWKDFDNNNQANWPEMAQWLHQRLSKFREIIESLAFDPEPNPAES